MPSSQLGASRPIFARSKPRSHRSTLRGHLRHSTPTNNLGLGVSCLGATLQSVVCHKPGEYKRLHPIPMRPIS